MAGLVSKSRACPTLATTPARLAQARVSTTLAKLGQARVSTPSRSFRVDALKTWMPATGAGMMTQHASLRNLSTQRTLHGGDDPVLRRLVEIAVHRQADDLLREPLGDREAAVRTGEMRVGFLLVQRLGIVDRRRNAFGFERRREAVAPARLETDRVLCPHRGEAARQARHDRDIAERIAVARRRLVARDDFVAEDAQLLEQYRRLDGVEPSGQADAHIVVFVGVVAVHAQAGDQCGKLVVIGEDRSAVAIAATASWSAGRPNRSTGMTALGLSPRRLAWAIARLRLAGSMLNVASSTSANTGVAPSSATTSAVAQNVKEGQITASPGPMPFAISTSTSASVPLAQLMAWRAPQNVASSPSRTATSGPRMNWQCAVTRAIASSIRAPSRWR